MPVPLSCFTCGKRIITDKENLYDIYLKLCSKFKDIPDDESPEFRALSELKIFKLCCRKMYLGIQCTDEYII